MQIYESYGYTESDKHGSYDIVDAGAGYNLVADRHILGRGRHKQCQWGIEHPETDKFVFLLAMDCPYDYLHDSLTAMARTITYLKAWI